MKLLLRLLILSIFFSFNLYAQEVSRIIVKVNNQVITSRDLDEYCKVLSYRFFNGNDITGSDDDQFKQTALARLIEDTLILDKAKQEGIEIAPSRVESKINQMIAAYPTREDFEESLVEKGLTIELLRRKIEDQYRLRDIVDREVKSQINITPKEVSAYYLKHSGELYSTLGYVFYVAKSANIKLLDKIAALIAQKGISQASLRYGNTLMRLESNYDELRPEISKILDGLALKQYKIVKVDDVFHLIFLEDKLLPRQLSLEEAKENIYSYLWDIKFREKFDKWVDRLKDEAVITNYYE